MHMSEVLNHFSSLTEHRIGIILYDESVLIYYAWTNRDSLSPQAIEGFQRQHEVVPQYKKEFETFYDKPLYEEIDTFSLKRLPTRLQPTKFYDGMLYRASPCYKDQPLKCRFHSNRHCDCYEMPVKRIIKK